MSLERRLRWDACWNVRDLGGLPTADGGLTRLGALVRADRLSRLTGAGVRAVVEYGVRTVVDLQFPDETARTPHPFRDAAQAERGVQYVNVPISSGRSSTTGGPPSVAIASAAGCADGRVPTGLGRPSRAIAGHGR